MMVGDGPEKKKAEYLCQELGFGQSNLFWKQ
jgi:hypothetical protein